MTEDKDYQLTEQGELFVRLMFDEDATGGDIKKAFELAGYKDTNLSHMLRSKAIQQAIKERTEEYLAANGPRAAMELIKIFRDPGKVGAKMVRDVACDVLGMNGIIKKIEQNQPIAMPNVTIVLPAKND